MASLLFLYPCSSLVHNRILSQQASLAQNTANVWFIVILFLRSRFTFTAKINTIFLVIRRISLISAYSLLSACYFVGLSTRYQAHFVYKHIILCNP